MIQKIKTLQTIHLAICAGTIMAYLFAGNISMEILKAPKIDSSSIPYLAIPFAAILIGNLLFKFQLRQIDSKLKTEDNLPTYQTASIIRWAILEGSAFLILFLSPEFIIFGILLILYLIYLRPTEDKINNDIKN